MGKRVRQRDLSTAAGPPEAGRAGVALGDVVVPREGRFALLHDPLSPLRWTLLLEGAGAWAVPCGLPPRPEEARVASSVGAEGVGEGLLLWDDGAYRAEDAGAEPDSARVHLEGKRVRGRYALRWQGADAWLVERLDPASLRPLPDRVLPMLATPAPYPEDEARWAFEPKWDGIRVLATVEGPMVRLRTRNLNDVTRQYPELQSLAVLLGGRQAVLDGEIVALDTKGHPSFQRLQARLGVVQQAAVRQKTLEVPITYVAFDLLHLDGHDVTRLPYEERRALLESLDLAGPHVQVSPAFVGRGRDLLATPGLEGIVAKRLGSAYEPGARSRAWLKVKTQRRQEMVIAGWSPGRGARAGRIGSLLLGYHDRTRAEARAAGEPQRLLFGGSVGTGFTDETLRDLEELLSPFVRETSPFAEGDVKKGATYVEPRFLAEIEFTEWTRAGHLRHPSFKGLRQDKDPRDVVREDKETDTYA